MRPVKIGFVLLSNSRHPLPSTRIAVLNMFPFLRAANFEPHIVFEPTFGTEMPDLSSLAPRLLAEGFGVIFFQKVRGPSVERLARQLSGAGVTTVYGVCDLVEIAMVDATDATIVVTEHLKSVYPEALKPKIHVVHDGIEHPEARKKSWSTHQGSRNDPLSAVLVTSRDLDHLPVLGEPPEWLEVTIVGRYQPAGQIMRRLRQARWHLRDQRNWTERRAYLRFLSNRRIRRVPWDPVDVYERMQQADIGIIPIQYSPEQEASLYPPSWELKSENRLTMKMCVGLPVIATSIPAYDAVIEQGRSGFIARSRQDWIDYLEELRNPTRRRDVGERARELVLKRYSLDQQAHGLIMVLRDLMPDSS